MRVTLAPFRIKPRAFPPGLTRYCPTITPALLMPPTVVVSAPGTRTVLNLKVKGGALAAVAVIMNANTYPATHSDDLQAFIVFLLGKRFSVSSWNEKRQRLYTDFTGPRMGSRLSTAETQSHKGVVPVSYRWFWGE